MDARRLARVLTTRGLLHIRVCRLCGCLILRAARDQHDRHHRTATLERD